MSARGVALQKAAAGLSIAVRYLTDDRGQAATEYVLIVGVIVLVIVAAHDRLQKAFRALFTRLAELFVGPGV